VLFQPFRKLPHLISVLLVALLVLPTYTALAEAENPPTDMNFSLNFVQDVNKNFIFTVGCQNNTLDTIGSVFAYLPLNNRLEYQYYTSSSATSYVRRVVPERLEIAFGDVKPGACSPVKVFMKRLNNARGTWTVFTTGHYDGEPSIDGVRSDPVTVDLDGTGANNPIPTLSGGGPARPGDKLTFSGSGYNAYELVSLWYNLPDGRVLPVSPLATINADDQGKIQFTIQLVNNAPTGTVSVVAYGQTSHLTSLGFITVSTE
jgi:hypothetical protein